MHVRFSFGAAQVRCHDLHLAGSLDPLQGCAVRSRLLALIDAHVEIPGTFELIFQLHVMHVA